MTAYNFNETQGTLLTDVITGAKLMAGSSGALSSLVVDANNHLVNTDDFSIIGFYNESQDDVSITLETGYNRATSADTILAAIRCSTTEEGYTARLSSLSGNSFSRVALQKSGSFLANLFLTTPLDTTAGQIKLRLYFDNGASNVVVEVYQDNVLLETLTHNDPAPLAANGGGAMIGRDSGTSPRLDVFEDNSVPPLVSYRGASAEIKESESFEVHVKSATITPTTANTTAAINGKALTVNSVTYDGTNYVITMATPTDLGVLYSDTGYPIAMVIDGNNLDTPPIPFKPVSTDDYITIQNPSFLDSSLLHGWEDVEPADGFQAVFNKVTSPDSFNVIVANSGEVTIGGEPTRTQTFNRYVRNLSGYKGTSATFTVQVDSPVTPDVTSNVNATIPMISANADVSINNPVVESSGGDFGTWTDFFSFNKADEPDAGTPVTLDVSATIPSLSAHVDMGQLQHVEMDITVTLPSLEVHVDVNRIEQTTIDAAVELPSLVANITMSNGLTDYTIIVDTRRHTINIK